MKPLPFLTEKQNLCLQQILAKKKSRFDKPSLMPHELITKAGVSPDGTLDVLKALEAQRVLELKATVYHTTCLYVTDAVACFWDDPEGEHGRFHCEHCDDDFEIKDARVSTIGFLR